tara:strand:- start:3274 stop:3450 length:177 start_codon:yes stop_codon:yes gene_type:complete
MNEKVEPGQLVGPMKLPASFLKEGGTRTPPPNSGVPKRHDLKVKKKRSGRIPEYYRNF